MPPPNVHPGDGDPYQQEDEDEVLVILGVGVGHRGHRNDEYAGDCHDC